MSAPTPDETILGLLASQPQHGYQLLETFNRADGLGNVWTLSTSQLYAVLKRLERHGWITGQQLESESAPPRTEYAITQKGRDHLNLWLNEPNPSSSVRRVRVEFLSRLYIAQLLGIPAQPIIARQRTACREERAKIQSIQDNSPIGVGWLASELLIAQLEAVLQWIDRCALVLYPTQA